MAVVKRRRIMRYPDGVDPPDGPSAASESNNSASGACAILRSLSVQRSQMRVATQPQQINDSLTASAFRSRRAYRTLLSRPIRRARASPRPRAIARGALQSPQRPGPTTPWHRQEGWRVPHALCRVPPATSTETKEGPQPLPLRPAHGNATHRCHRHAHEPTLAFRNGTLFHLSAGAFRHTNT